MGGTGRRRDSRGDRKEQFSTTLGRAEGCRKKAAGRASGGGRQPPGREQRLGAGSRSSMIKREPEYKRKHNLDVHLEFE